MRISIKRWAKIFYARCTVKKIVWYIPFPAFDSTRSRYDHCWSNFSRYRYPWCRARENQISDSMGECSFLWGFLTLFRDLRAAWPAEKDKGMLWERYLYKLFLKYFLKKKEIICRNRTFFMTNIFSKHTDDSIGINFRCLKC